MKADVQVMVRAGSVRSYPLTRKLDIDSSRVYLRSLEKNVSSTAQVILKLRKELQKYNVFIGIAYFYK